ncbi:aado/keto reductase [Dendrothele bispora CBS 962.96]|uniref:Aado/keto reductase n=1 Tax=Dendrothele bispora (strain CBS 962.96) TaxID=1314807 RepID=A0A4S8LFT4_DENBC|nr:aado/keto reductase [Dendrothele bispora CBS 962.96]
MSTSPMREIGEVDEIPRFRLNDETSIPAIGLGCWMGFPHGPGESTQVTEMVERALKVGYRHLDTASNYGNERSVGLAIKGSGVPREEIYVTTKLSGEDHGHVAQALDRSLEKLQMDYVDMYLMHWPQALDDNGNALQPEESPTILDTWRQMEEMVHSGKTKSIGVSNFSVKTLQVLLGESEGGDGVNRQIRIIPALNQIECHPCLPQHSLLAFCKEKGIHVTAYSPLGKNTFSEDEDVVRVVSAINSRCGSEASATQVLLSWAVQRGTSVIPKSVGEERLRENLRLIQLDEDSMTVLDNLHQKEGMHRSVCGFHSTDSGGSCFGWTYEQLGWGMTVGGVVLTR